MRTVEVEHVWVAGDGRSQVGVCAGFPLIFEGCAVDALQAHGCDATSNDVESSSQGDDINRIFLAIFGDDAVLGKFNNRISILL